MQYAPYRDTFFVSEIVCIFKKPFNALKELNIQ